MAEPTPLQILCGTIARSLRQKADALAYSMTMAKARGDDSDDTAQGQMDAILALERWHTAQAKQVKAETLPLYEPRYPSVREDAA